MYLHTQQLINEIVVDEPDPAPANALQEGLGGPFGEMRASAPTPPPGWPCWRRAPGTQSR